MESIQLMVANVPFAHRYENPGSVNRLDVYIPADKVKDIDPRQNIKPGVQEAGGELKHGD